MNATDGIGAVAAGALVAAAGTGPVIGTTAGTAAAPFTPPVAAPLPPLPSLPPSRLPRWLRREYSRWGTGLFFVLFGLGALLLGTLWFPLLRLRHRRDRDASERAVQRALSAGCRVFVSWTGALQLLRWHWSGAGHLRTPGVLVVANHPTLVDVVFLIALMPQADCIVKAALWRNPFLRWPVVAAGYIPNDERDPQSLLARCAEKLAAGRSLIVFPEGTRSTPGRPLAMRRGAAQIALAAGCPIVPVTLRCEPPILYKGVPWHRVHDDISDLVADVEAPLPMAALLPAGLPGPVAARRLTAWFAAHFAARLGQPQSAADEPSETGR